MTAINVVLKRDRALMMTDAAMYLPSGEIIAFGQKAVAMPTLKAALACRGGQLQTALLALELPAIARTFDELTIEPAVFGAAVSRVLSSYEAVLTWSHVQVVIAGWSFSKARARAFFYDSETDAVEEVDGWAFGPLPNEEEFANLHRIGCEIDEDVSVDAFRADRHGIPLMEAQRRMRTSVSGMDGEHHIVGGNVLVTEVDVNGVSQRVIHAWPDEVGRPLQPEPFRLPAVPAANLNRQQRRAMERQWHRARA